MIKDQRKIGVLLSYASLGVGVLITLITTPITLSLMGEVEYGLNSSIITFASFLTLLQMGLGTAYIRFYSRKKAYGDTDGIAQLNGIFLTLYSVISVIALILGSLMVVKADMLFKNDITAADLHRVRIAMSILVINTVIYFPATVFDSNITVNERFVFSRCVTILKAFVSPMIMIPLLIVGLGSVGSAIATTLTGIVCTVINVVYCFKKLNFKAKFVKIQVPFLREIVTFTGFVFITICVDQLNWSLDRMILTKINGSTEVAIYTVADQLAVYFNTLAITVSSVFAPSIHRMVANHEGDGALSHVFTKVGRVSFLMLSMVFIGFIFFGEPFVYMWTGKKQSLLLAFPIAILLFSAKLVPAIQSLGLQVQQAKNKHKVPAIMYLCIAILNIFISIPFCRMYGAVGAAIGTVISSLIGNVFINIYYFREVGLDIKMFWSQILKLVPAMIAPAIVGVVVTITLDLNRLPQIILGGVIFLISYFVSMWFFGFNEFEKGIIRKPVAKIAQKFKRN